MFFFSSFIIIGISNFYNTTHKNIIHSELNVFWFVTNFSFLFVMKNTQSKVPTKQLHKRDHFYEN